MIMRTSLVVYWYMADNPRLSLQGVGLADSFCGCVAADSGRAFDPIGDKAGL